MSPKRSIDKWTWLDDPPDRALSNAGKVTLELLLQAHRWVTRRIDRVSFRDADTAHHKVIIECWLPPNLPAVGKVPAVGEAPEKFVYIVPLSLLAKRPGPLYDSAGRPMRLAQYSHLEIIDQNGNHLPRITGRQSARVAAAVLVTFAEQILRKPLEPSLHMCITRMTIGGAQARADALTYFFQRMSVKTTRQGVWLRLHIDMQRGTLSNHVAFKELAYTLAHDWIVLTLFVGDVPSRSVITLSYYESLQRNVSQSSRGFVAVSVGSPSSIMFGFMRSVRPQLIM